MKLLITRAMILLVFILIFSDTVYGQNQFSDADSVAITSSNESDYPTKYEKVVYQISQGAVVGAMVWDMQTTARNISTTFHVNYQRCENASCSSVVSVEKTVGFTETGWTSMLGIRDTDARSIVIANAIYGAGLLTVNHLLYKKGGAWRKVAIGLNFFQASLSLYGAVANNRKMNYEKSNLVPRGAFNVQLKW